LPWESDIRAHVSILHVLEVVTVRILEALPQRNIIPYQLEALRIFSIYYLLWVEVF